MLEVPINLDPMDEQDSHKQARRTKRLETPQVE